MGHTRGKVRDVYISEVEASDRFCARVVAGLPWDSLDFATLPPHFKAAQNFRPDFWRALLPDFEFYPACYRTCLQPFLANLVWHQDYLLGTTAENGDIILPGKLSPNHPFRSSLVVTSGTLQSMKGQVICEPGVHICPHTGMRASGLPPTILLGIEMNKVKEGQTKITAELTELRTEVQEMRSGIPAAVSAELIPQLLNNFAGLGPNACAPDQVSSIVNQALTAALGPVTAGLVRMEEAIARVGAPPGEEEPEHEPVRGPLVPLGGDRLYTHANGVMCRIPEGWEWPQDLKLASLWSLWMCGDASRRICPYRFFDGVDMKQPIANQTPTARLFEGVVRAQLKEAKTNKTTWSKATQVMHLLINAAMDSTGASKSDIFNASVVASNAHFMSAFDYVNTNNLIKGQLKQANSFATVYSKLNRNR
jgi:hypothetical protein